MLRTILLLALATAASLLAAQYTGYSIKGGPLLGIQNWDNYPNQPLYAYHIDLQVESISDEQPRTLYASLGYHRRGSTIRSRNGFTQTGEVVRIEPLKFIFNNAVLALGAKQTYPVGNFRGHVALALRGEYNINTDLGGAIAERSNELGYGIFYPIDEFVNDFVYGIDLGAGLDVSISPRLDALLELRVSPDLSRQYFQPSFTYSRNNQSGGSQQVVEPETTINNISFELSVGLRFVRYTGPSLEE